MRLQSNTSIELRLVLSQLRDELAELAALATKIRSEGFADENELSELISRHALLNEQARRLLQAYVKDNTHLAKYLFDQIFEIDLSLLLQREHIVLPAQKSG